MGRGLPGVRESMTTGKRQQQLLCAPGLAMAAFLAIMLWFGLSRASMGAGAMPVEDEQRTEYGSFEMEMIYKYSQRFQEVTKGRPEWEHLAEDSWVRLETAEFYHKLVTEDRHRHASRNLLTADDAYSLSPTNATYFIRTLGSIHYSLLELGTPPKLFLVGLDTGSDLLWVPCDCRQCSKANWASYGLDLNIDFAIYNTSSSTTSKPVPCTSSVCTDTLTTNRTRSCNANAPQLCTYDSNYLSPNTSSSGTLVQDVVYLNPETGTGISNITADIYLGCGSLQTGDFLTGGAPNGLFGLGPAVYSVPSTLARNNVTKNVFSMCFSSTHDVGRLVFGKNPSASLQNTPLLTVDPSLYYVLELEGLKAGDLSLNVSGEAIFDTGTSITTFPSDVSKRLGAALSSKANLESFSFSFSQGTLFSNCWNATTKAQLEALSSFSVTFKGGGVWEIQAPLAGFANSQGDLEFVCLGIVGSESLNAPPIIGFNFMGGYEYFFDMGTSKFSWGPSDCSGANLNSSSLSPDGISNISPESAPVPASSPITQPARQGTPATIPTNASPASEQSNAYTNSLSPSYISFLILLTTFLHLSVAYRNI